MASAYWIRWMLVSENYDEDIIYLARMAPTRWFRGSEAFGITEAPTRFGRVDFTMCKTTEFSKSPLGHTSFWITIFWITWIKKTDTAADTPAFG